jgi:excinuclease UvrABC nuclease subunit
MMKAASELDFLTAARYRDELSELEKIYKKEKMDLSVYFAFLFKSFFLELICSLVN